MRENNINLDRIVAELRETRKTHMWWRYTIKDGKISIISLQSSRKIFIGSIFIALLRDHEFRHFYCSKNNPLEINYDDKFDEKSIDLNNIVLYYNNGVINDKIIFNFNREYRLNENIIDIDLDIFLKALYSLEIFRPYIEQHIIPNKDYTMHDTQFYFSIPVPKLVLDSKTNWYRRSHNIIVKDFSTMISSDDIPYIRSKHLGGFTKDTNILHLYSENKRKQFLVNDENGNNMYDKFIKPVFGKRFAEFVIFYFRHNFIINDKIMHEIMSNDEDYIYNKTKYVHVNKNNAN